MDLQLLENLQRANEILDNLELEFVFVGGVTAQLYYQKESFFKQVRPTIDVDCIVDILNYSDHNILISNKMTELGMAPGQEPGDPICRWRGLGAIIDIMPINENVLGFTNQWYKPGWENTEIVTLPNKKEIKIFSYPYFLASKLEAYKNRGMSNPRLSHDLEDIILTLASRNNLNNDLNIMPAVIVNYFKEFLNQMRETPYFDEFISAYLPGSFANEIKTIEQFFNKILIG